MVVSLQTKKKMGTVSPPSASTTRFVCVSVIKRYHSKTGLSQHNKKCTRGKKKKKSVSMCCSSTFPRGLALTRVSDTLLTTNCRSFCPQHRPSHAAEWAAAPTPTPPTAPAPVNTSCGRGEVKTWSFLSVLGANAHHLFVLSVDLQWQEEGGKHRRKKGEEEGGGRYLNCTNSSNVPQTRFLGINRTDNTTGKNQ